MPRRRMNHRLVSATSGAKVAELPIRPITSILELGVAEKVAEKLQTLLSYDRGLIVLAAAPSNGLPTTFDVVVNSADRMVRDFASLLGERCAEPTRRCQLAGICPSYANRSC